MSNINTDREGWCEDQVKKEIFADVAQCLEQTTPGVGGKRKRTRRHRKLTHKRRIHHKRRTHKRRN